MNAIDFHRDRLLTRMFHLLPGVRNCGDYERAWILQSQFCLDMGKGKDEMGYIVFAFKFFYTLDSPLDFFLKCPHITLHNIKNQPFTTYGLEVSAIYRNR